MIGILGQRPGLAHERSNTPTDGQIDTLDESSLDESCKAIPDKAGEALGFQELVEIFALAPTHTHGSEVGVAAFTAFDELTMQQVFRNLPMISAGTLRAEPTSEMSGTLKGIIMIA